jgi:hypothetical protein
MADPVLDSPSTERSKIDSGTGHAGRDFSTRYKRDLQAAGNDFGDLTDLLQLLRCAVRIVRSELSACFEIDYIPTGLYAQFIRKLAALNCWLIRGKNFLRRRFQP